MTRLAYSTRHRRLAARVTMRVIRATDLAAALRISLARLGVYLSNLRDLGVAISGAVYFPARAGRPVEALTYVTVETSCPEALRRFEAYCQDDPLISTAVAITGRFDYALWSFHADPRAARDWSHRLELRDEVRRAHTETVRILFGHTFEGGVILGAPPARPPVRSSTAAARSPAATSSSQVPCLDPTF